MGGGRSRSRHRDVSNNRRRGRSPACDNTGSPAPDYTQLGPWAHCNTPEPDDGLLRPSSALSDYSTGRGRAGSAASDRAPSRTLAPPTPDERRGRSQSVAGHRSRANSVASNRAPSAAPRGRARARACSPPPDLPDRGFRRAPRHEDVNPDQIECSELPTTSDLFELLELDTPVPLRTHPFIRTDTFNVVTDERWFNLARRAFPGDILFIGSVILTEWWLACDLLPTELSISLRELVCDRVSLAPSVDTKEAERIVNDLWDYLRGTRFQLRNLDRFCEKRVEVAIPERPSDDLDDTTQPEQVMVDFFRQALAPYSNKVRQFFFDEKAAATKAKHQDILTRTPPIDKAIIAICWLVIFGIRGAYECEGIASGDYCSCPYHVRLSKSMVIAGDMDGHAQVFSHFNWAKLCAWWFCHVEVIIPRIEPAPKTADLFITKSNDPQPKVPAYNPAQHNKKKKPRSPLPDHNAPPAPAIPSTLQLSSTGDASKNHPAPHGFGPALHADKATSPSTNQHSAVLPPTPTMVKNQPVAPKRGGYNIKVPPPKPQPGDHALQGVGSLSTVASSAMVTATPNPALTSSSPNENNTVVLRDKNKAAVPATNVPRQQQAQVNTGTVKAKKRNKAKAANIPPAAATPAVLPPAAVVPYAAMPALSVPPSNYASSSDGSTLAEDLPADKLSSDTVHLSLHYAPSGATMVDIRQDTAFSMLLSTWSSKVASDHAKASTTVGSPPSRFMFIWNNQSLKLNDTPKGVGMSHHETVTVLDSTDIALAMECLDPYFFQEVARSITHRRIYGNGFNLSPELRNLSSLVTEMWERRIQTAPSKPDQRVQAAPPREPTFDQLYTPGNLGYSSVDTSTLRTSGWGERGLLHGDFDPAPSKRE